MSTPAPAFVQLVNKIGKEGLNPKNVGLVSAEIAKTFGVREHEVGILKLEKTLLRFIYPPKLATVGTIPVSTSTIAVAARVVNTKVPEIINNLAQTKHASVFEAIELQHNPKAAGQRGKPDDKLANVIQKMMTVPVIRAVEVVGVIEVSRKGKTAPEAGPDFTPADLRKLLAIAVSLANSF